MTLKVYDIIGREVMELVNQKLAAGYHQYQFNANNLAGGVYLYRITAVGSMDGKESRFSDKDCFCAFSGKQQMSPGLLIFPMEYHTIPASI